jgi:phosphatidylethanolamine-binding protein (PEBP) family uncharacterized protein
LRLEIGLRKTIRCLFHRHPFLEFFRPAEEGGIPEGRLPEGAVSSTTNIGRGGYFGPGAPRGERYHHYVFEVYALSAVLDLGPEAIRDELLEAMGPVVVAKSAYVGRYHQ